MSLNDQEFLKLIQELKELLEHGEKLCRKVENLFQERKDALQTYDSHENFLRSLGYTNEEVSRKVSEYRSKVLEYRILFLWDWMFLV